jgi:ribosome-associated protein
MREVEIHTEPVELFKILKFEGMVASGGEAKRVIDAGEVRVNGAVETRRRRQIRAGDTIEFAGEKLVIRLQSLA